MSAVDPITQERVYRALKADYLAGRFHAGEKLEIQDIADRHGSSKTPVREAACRLMGEGLVEPDRAGGFRIILAAPGELIQLYAWNMHLLLSLAQAMKTSVLRQTLDRFSGVGIGDTPVELATLTGSIFLAFAQATGNSEAVASIAQINERLYYPRIVETTKVKEVARELRTLTNPAVADVHKAIRRRIESYHERRIGHQREIVAKLAEPD